MEEYAWNFLEYHEKSQNRPSDAQPISPDEWPQEWTKVYYKAYPRFPQRSLPAPCVDASLALRDVLIERRSVRDFDVDSRLRQQQLSNILSGIMITAEPDAIELTSRRAYPSAGGRYPLEAYVLPLRVEGLTQCVYHYHARVHGLEELWTFTNKELSACFPHNSWAHSSGAVVVLTAYYKRSSVKYLERAYRYCLLEAGHAAQNICLLASAEGLGCCPYGGFDDEPLMRLLSINPVQEIPVYALFIGGPLQTNERRTLNLSQRNS